MKHQQERIAETYLMLRDALRQLSGNGLFRGNECYIQHLNQLRLPFEHRGNALNHREYVLHLTPEADALWAGSSGRRSRRLLGLGVIPD